MEKEILREKIEGILKYEEHIIDEWEDGLQDAKEMVEKALEENPDNKWLKELWIALQRAFETECALADVKSLLECINDTNMSGEDVEDYEKEVSESIDLCEMIVDIVKGEENKRKEREKELLKSFKELNIK